VPSTSAENQPVLGSLPATYFITPDNRRIPIKVVEEMNKHTLVGLCTGDLRWFVKGGFDNIGPKIGPGVWIKSPDDRYERLEAPYGGATQLGARECRGHFQIQDMRYDL
jgi:hypothetical protein